MKAKFIGDPNDNFSGPDTIAVGGVDFPKGKAVDLSSNPNLFGKLEGNSHFETVGGKDDQATADKKKVGIAKAAAAKAIDKTAVRGKFTKDRPRDEAKVAAKDAG